MTDPLTLHEHGRAGDRPAAGAGHPVTVVVATKDRPALLAGALTALGRSLRPGDRAIVVDSASSDRRVREVVEAFGVDLVACPRAGACRARNAGLGAATTGIVAFTDDDCRPEPGWVTALAAAFAGDPRPDFVTGQVLEDARPGRAQLALSVLDSPHPASFGAGDDPAGIGHGANMAWQKASLEAIGGFDECLGPGAPLRAAEDHDAFWRALRNGATGRFDPSAVVVHHQWRSRRAQLGTYFGYGVGSGALGVKQLRLAGRPATGGDREMSEVPLDVGGTVSYILGQVFWREGVVPIVRNLTSGYEMGAVAEAVKLAGGIRGALLGRHLGLVDGRFVPDP